jgi:hypothetical protein
MIATIGSITDKAFQSVFTPFTPTEQPIDVDRIVSLIKQDHEYWRRRREGR